MCGHDQAGALLIMNMMPLTLRNALGGRGEENWYYFDGEGNMTESIVLDADGHVRALSVPKGQWHSSESRKY